MTTRESATAAANELQLALADDSAFAAWYRRTVPRVFSYVMGRCGGDRDLAEEVTQLTFIAAVDGRWGFDGRSEGVTWLCGIARHKLADHYRALERIERRQMRMRVREIESGPSIESEIDQRRLIAEAFGSLPSTQRAMLAFVALDGLSVAEAGRLLGKNPRAATSLLHRAREGFRRAYRGEDPDD